MKYRKSRRIKNKKSVNTAPLVVFCVIIFVSSIFVTIKVAASGAKLSLLEQEISSISKENQDYRRKLVNSSSLTKLEESVEGTDFIKPQELIYISKDEPVAQLP